MLPVLGVNILRSPAPATGQPGDSPADGAGSAARPSWTGPGHSYKALHHRLTRDGVIIPGPNPGIARFARNYAFASRSAAAAVVTGHQANGRGAWKPPDSGLSYGRWHFCTRMPEIIPAMPPVLTHGDLWTGNLLGSAGGLAVIDPSVSCTWAEVDLSMLWSYPRSPASDRFFDLCQEPSPSPPGWAGRRPLLHLRELLSVVPRRGRASGRSETGELAWRQV